MLQMCVNLLTGNLLRNNATFINNRYRNFIIDCILESIFINQWAEFCICVLCRNDLSILILRLFLNERCPGKGNFHCFWEHFIHIDIKLAILCSVSLINKKEQILAIITVFLLNGSLKFINQCCYYGISIILKKLNQALAGFRLVRTHLRVNEVITNLFIQINAVSNHNKARLLDWTVWLHAFTNNHLCQHNHRDRFATTLGMPNNTVSCVGVVPHQNTIHTLFDCKVLLVSAYLFHIIIIDDKVTNQIQQPLRVQQRHQCTILLLDLTIGGAFSAPIIQPLFVVFMP